MSSQIHFLFGQCSLDVQLFDLIFTAIVDVGFVTFGDQWILTTQISDQERTSSDYELVNSD